MTPQGPQPIDTKGVLPLAPADFHVLLALLNQPRHGYAIMQDVTEASGGRVRAELGSLYRIIGRLVSAGFVREAHGAATGAHAGRKRRYYELSALGREVLAAETARMRDAVALAERLDVHGGEVAK